MEFGSWKWWRDVICVCWPPPGGGGPRRIWPRLQRETVNQVLTSKTQNFPNFYPLHLCNKDGVESLQSDKKLLLLLNLLLLLHSFNAPYVSQRNASVVLRWLLRRVTDEHAVYWSIACSAGVPSGHHFDLSALIVSTDTPWLAYLHVACYSHSLVEHATAGCQAGVCHFDKEEWLGELLIHIGEERAGGGRDDYIVIRPGTVARGARSAQRRVDRPLLCVIRHPPLSATKPARQRRNSIPLGSLCTARSASIWCNCRRRRLAYIVDPRRGGILLLSLQKQVHGCSSMV